MIASNDKILAHQVFKIDKDEVTAKAQKLIDDNSYTYNDCIKYLEVMAHHVRSQMRKGHKKTGYPIIDPEKGHVPPDPTQMYDATAVITTFKAHMTKPHTEMPFLRAVSLNHAIEHVRNEGHVPIQVVHKYFVKLHPLHLNFAIDQTYNEEPPVQVNGSYYLYISCLVLLLLFCCVKVRAHDMPTGDLWNNFPQCLYRVHAAYCAKEGLTRTSDMSVSVLYFMFYGVFSWSTKNSKKQNVIRPKPFIFFLHKKMVGARSRFAAKVPDHFSKFISLFETNKDDWTPFLMDKGKGSPPLEYLTSFEEGLRNYGSCVHSMGTRPLRSRESWSNVAQWRKREAYIALGRYVLKADTGYKQWDCFRFLDYTMRQSLGKTFDVRHFPLSDGRDDENFGKNKLDFDWKKHAYEIPKRVKSEPGEYENPGVTSLPHVSDVKDQRPMIYDVELGKLVPL